MKRLSSLLTASLLCGAPALAQSFNLDVGPNTILYPAPSNSYGAAAAQPGHWMEFKDPFLATALEDLGGAPTGVTLESDVSSWVQVFPSVIGASDDSNLMEDFQWLPNLDVPVTWLFTGLENGLYDLYTYASDPSSSAMSKITVAGSPDGTQIIGSPWPGQHVLGLTYAKHSVAVSDGTLTVTAMGSGAQPNNSGALNGFQLVKVDGNPGDDIGTNYCDPANLNSTGLSAVIAAFGSVVAAANDVQLTASQLPMNKFGYFLTSMTQGFVPFAGGSQGDLCLGGAIGRYRSDAASSGAGGEIVLQLDLTNTPTPSGTTSVVAGDTWNFQLWFRDNNPTSTSNFTDGVSIVFQ